jgi:hypothetical protein
MPNSMIEKDAREGKGSKKSLEKDWDKAKEDSKESTGKDDDWALTNYIYQKRKKAHSSVVVCGSTHFRGSKWLVNNLKIRLT